jgi:hypothetical protein
VHEQTVVTGRRFVHPIPGLLARQDFGEPRQKTRFLRRKPRSRTQEAASLDRRPWMLLITKGHPHIKIWPILERWMLKYTRGSYTYIPER